MANESDRQSLLRRSLAANAVFSTLSGLTFALGASSVASFMGLADPGLVAGVGVMLLGFAALVGWVSTRRDIPLPMAMTIVFGDLGWVVGTVPIVFLDVLNGPGTVAAVVIADIVLLFAVLQYVGVVRVRRNTEPLGAAAR